MSDYLATFQEPDFLADEVCVYILSHTLDIGIGVLTKSGVWTTTLADNMSNCEKYFAYCGPGIFIPIKRIKPGEGKILEERYLKTKEKAPKKGGKGGKGKSGIKKEKDKTEPPAKAAKTDTTTNTSATKFWYWERKGQDQTPAKTDTTTTLQPLRTRSRTKQTEKITNSKTI